jgi:hypothetical protein
VAFAALSMILATAGCKGVRGMVTGAQDAAPADGGGGGLEAAASAAIDAGAPADDSIPATSSDELTMRARHLLEAVAKDDPDLATDIVFPRAAWLALNDSNDPAREWDKRVDRPFRRALHRLSRHADGAQFVSLELGHSVLQELVKRHGWRKPLWSVRDSRLTYVESGHTRTISIREMTAWRGAWYITRLR